MKRFDVTLVQAVILGLFLAVSFDAFGETSESPIVTLSWALPSKESSCAEQRGPELLGLRYAQPPTGSNRFMPAVTPAPTWTGGYSATSYGNVCPQLSKVKSGGTTTTEVVGSEDCLFLNVFRPKTITGKLPVMFWIHGGGFIEGSGGSSTSVNGSFLSDFDAGNLAVGGKVIVVTINYRLGRLGWLAHPALAQLPGGQLGNYGLSDQIAALAWVQANISGFGGDPTNVTVFGESAGGMSVLYLLTSPKAKGLFARAISESGFPMEATSAQASILGGEVTANVGCTGSDSEIVQCLQQVSPATFVRSLIRT